MHDDYPCAAELCGMSDSVRIERLANGYTVRMTDPKIVKYNDNRYKNEKKGGDIPPYRNPDREYVFASVDAVLKFLKTNLDKALPGDEFSSAFDNAVADTDNDGE